MQKFGILFGLSGRVKSMLVVFAILVSAYLGEIYHPYTVLTDAGNLIASRIDLADSKSHVASKSNCEEKGYRTYLVEPGDNLTKISEWSGKSLSSLRKANNMHPNQTLIKAESVLCVPDL